MYPAIAQLVPVAFISIPVGLVYGLIKYWEWQSKNFKKKNPLTSDLLRGPGEALREKLYELKVDLFAYLLLIFFFPVFIFMMSLSLETYSSIKPSLTSHFINFVIGLIAVLYSFFRITKNKKLIQQYNLGLDAEIAVGQELNYLMREGYWVYHDFPADNFNIDHVLIGPSGVFAIETKGRAKPINKDGAAEREVVYDGEALHFLHKREYQPLQQAESQAKWLQKWLSSAVGEEVGVTPVLAIPGWFIKRTSPRGIPVINGKNPGAFFARYDNQKLTEKLQRQIVHQVDNRCRTVSPRAYQPMN